MKQRNWLFGCLAVLVAVVASLLVVEATLHLFPSLLKISYMQWLPDGHIRGRGVPGSSFLLPDSKSRVRFNTMGFRGSDVSKTPQPNTLRIVVLGGSSAFNIGLRDEDTWPRQLQTALCKQHGVSAEVINLGMPGYNSRTSKINYLINGRYLEPHVALFYHTWNDLQAYKRLKHNPKILFANPSEPQGTLAGLSFWKRMVLGTKTGRFLMHHVYLPFIAPLKKAVIENPAEAGKALKLSSDIPTKEAFNWSKRNFWDFATLASKDGVLPVVVSQAMLVGPELNGASQSAIDLQRVRMTMPALIKTWSEMMRLIEDVATNTNAVYVDGYSHVPHSLEFLADHVHFKAEGARTLAIGIADDLMSDRRFLAVVDKTGAQTGKACR